MAVRCRRDNVGTGAYGHIPAIKVVVGRGTSSSFSSFGLGSVVMVVRCFAHCCCCWYCCGGNCSCCFDPCVYQYRAHVQLPMHTNLLYVNIHQLGASGYCGRHHQLYSLDGQLPSLPHQTKLVAKVLWYQAVSWGNKQGSCTYDCLYCLIKNHLLPQGWWVIRLFNGKMQALIYY